MAQAALRCDLAYEVLPGQEAASAAGLDAARLAALSRDQRLLYTEAEAERIGPLLAAVGVEPALELSHPAVTWGGWRGVSSPSIHLELRAQSAAEGWPAARGLAALLGWTYRQEAVLLACDAADAEADSHSLLPAYEVVPLPADFFAERDRHFAFFGTLIALAGDPDLGYTKLRDRFWTIDFGGGLEPALRRTAELLQGLAAGAVAFDVQVQPVVVELVGSDWGAEPGSEAYGALSVGVEMAELRRLRAEADAALGAVLAR